MRNWITAAICCLAITTTAATVAAQTPGQVSQFSPAGKRVWLRDRVLSEISDPFRRANMLAQLSRMSDFEVDQAISNYFFNLRNNNYGNYYGPGSVVGYQPVITTLPTGTSLGVGGIISPDGRHVRINAQPFFSSVGPVYTFNPVTGQSGVISRPRTRPRVTSPVQQPVVQPSTTQNAPTTRNVPTAIPRRGAVTPAGAEASRFGGGVSRFPR